MLVQLDGELIEAIKYTIQTECCGCGCCCNGEHDDGKKALALFSAAVESARQKAEEGEKTPTNTASHATSQQA